MDYDDNFEVDGESSGKNKNTPLSRALESSSSASKDVNLEEIIEIVLKMMRHLYHLSYRPQLEVIAHSPPRPSHKGIGTAHVTSSCKCVNKSLLYNCKCFGKEAQKGKKLKISQ